MLAELQNSGIEILNPAPAEEQATIIVAGVPRSGTTMVAKGLAALGIFLGSQIDASVQEDLLLGRVLGSGDMDKFREIVERYNRDHDVWAFKRPTAYQAIDGTLFRNPRFVLTFRDPVAIAKREAVSMKTDFRGALRRAAGWSVNLTDFAFRQTAPTMLVSYEKALQQPAEFAHSLIDFIGMKQDKSASSKVVAVVSPSPSDYVQKSQIRFPKKAP